MSEQKLREALQDLEREISSRFGANEDMSPELRKVILSARQALSQPTSDEGTPLTEAYLGEIFEDHRARGLDDFDHYRDMTGKLAGKCRELERTLHAKERELELLRVVCKELAATPTPSDSKPHPKPRHGTGEQMTTEDEVPWAVAARIREIHQLLKRGEDTKDHGVIGNLDCIYDSLTTVPNILDDPTPPTDALAPQSGKKEEKP